MRTTIDIPDNTYRELKIRAAREGKPLRQIVLRGIEREIAEPAPKHARRFKVPIIQSVAPGTIDLTNEQIYDLIDFP